MMPRAFLGLLLLGSIWLAAVFDVGVAPLIELRGCAPHACLLMAAASIVWIEGSYAILLAACCGLVVDLVGGGPLGLTMAGYALGGYCVLRLRGCMRLQGLLRQAAEQLGGIVLMSALPALMQAWSYAGVPLGDMFQHVGGVAVYTAALAAPLLFLAATTQSAFHKQLFSRKP